MSLLKLALGGAVVYLLMKRSDGAGAPTAVLPEGVPSPPPVGVPGLSQPPPGGAGPVATPIGTAPAWTGPSIMLPGGAQPSIALGPANVTGPCCPRGSSCIATMPTCLEGDFSASLGNPTGWIF